MSTVIKGAVRRGHGRGKQLGFPTLNVDYDGGESGIFAGVVELDGVDYGAAIYIGDKPTFGDSVRECEVHLLDFDGIVDEGCQVIIKTMKKLRDDRKFESKEELKTQIAKDVENVKNWYNRTDKR